jgi:hypothetical protein
MFPSEWGGALISLIFALFNDAFSDDSVRLFSISVSVTDQEELEGSCHVPEYLP